MLLNILNGASVPYEDSIKSLYEFIVENIEENEESPYGLEDFKIIPSYDSFSKTIHIYEEYLTILGYQVEYWHRGRNKEAMVTFTEINEEIPD